MTTTPAIAHARALRREATPPERRLWAFLRTLRPEGYHFRRQAPFRGYVLDFVCYGQRLVIELDGEQHATEARVAHDAIRDAVLAREGFRTLRFPAADVLRNLEGVSIAIREHLAAPIPHPAPPHRGEGEDQLPSPLWGGAGGGGRPQRIRPPMPFTPDMRRKVDQIRDYLYGGGYPDPLSNAEQLSFLFFFYMIEGIDAANLRQARATGRGYTSLFAGDWTLRNPLNAPTKGVETVPRERMRWSIWANAMSGEQLVTFVRDEVFPFFATIGDTFGMSFMAQARLSIDEPTVLTQIVTLVNELRLEQADPDTKGDLFEHVLRQIKQAGELGQFRTPRHIIRAIVDLVDPKIGETVYDPAAGTAGFLVAAYEHIRLANSSANGRDMAELEGKTFERGYGDRLNAAQWRKLQTATFYGNDVDGKMVSLASMNLALRGLPDVRILKRNVLTTSFDRQMKAEKGLPLDGYDVVLANPPFSGRLDRDRIVDDVRIGTSTATELLFVKYMIDNLKPGGRCGVVVPEGVLFGSTGAHKELRRILMQNNRVEAVLSLPGGVFQPYSGVKTSVLVFAKGGRTERVMFLHASNDGFKLDANHEQPIEADDLPGLIAAFNSRDERLADWQNRDAENPWTDNWWFADAATIEREDFNISASRYRPESRQAAEHRDPRELLAELRDEAAAILCAIEALAAELDEVVG